MLSAVVFGVVIAIVLSMPNPHVRAQGPGRQFELGPPPSLVNGGLGSMRAIHVAQPRDGGTGGDFLADYIANEQAAIVLGKAFFWEEAIGSDRIACASCHFHAGADNRVKNSLDPDLRGVPPGQFNPSSPTGSGAKGGPNYTLTAADFPFHRLSDPDLRDSTVTFDSSDVVSSQGVFATHFVTDRPRRPLDRCIAVADPNFMVGGVQTRRVEPRNTPTVIGAAFNFRNFWDGRANNRFNGVNPFGRRDQSAGVWKVQADGALAMVPVDLSNSSLASQAVGPPGSDFEMSCGGRNFAEIGHKVLPMRPLVNQTVDATDSVLGPFRHASSRGLVRIYADYVKLAFKPAFWKSAQNVTLDPANPTTTTYTLMEANFSLFFGLAVQEYEKTLIPDRTRWDDFVENPLVRQAIAAAQATFTPLDLSACTNTTTTTGSITTVTAPCGLTDQELHGLAIFEGDGIDATRAFAPDGRCSRCHKGPEFTGAGTHMLDLAQIGGLVERMTMGDFSIALYDSGFYNIGVTPTSRDLGIGAQDPFGNSLSLAMEFKAALANAGTTLDCSNLANSFRVGPDPFTVACDSFVEPGLVDSTFRSAIDGAVKVPTLRNVELTGPYFHNGGQATLEQVVAFYNRGGDRQGPFFADTSGFASNPSNADPDIEFIGMTVEDRAALVAFLKTLTDSRVVNESAPFDHPSLRVTNGHVGDNVKVARRPDGKAKDEYLFLPVVGALGRSAKGLPPVKPFLQ
ncbi:MAG TPA: cytochrome c peroxidase [Vicinamibacterales bacterium]|jgi:cytochrome c peroxidase